MTHESYLEEVRSLPGTDLYLHLIHLLDDPDTQLSDDACTLIEEAAHRLTGDPHAPSRAAVRDDTETERRSPRVGDAQEATSALHLYASGAA